MAEPFQKLGPVLMTEIPGAAERPAGSKKPLYIVHFVVVCDACDHMGRLKHFGSLFWACPRCLVLSQDQNVSHLFAPSRFDRTHLERVAQLYRDRVSADANVSSAAKAGLLSVGLRDDVFAAFLRVSEPIYNIPWTWALDYGRYSPFDLLHGFPLGILKHLQRTLFEFLSAKGNRALEHNVGFIGKYFSDGVSFMESFQDLDDLKKLSQIGGSGRESLMRLLLAAMLPNVIDDYEVLYEIQALFESALYIFSLIRGRPSKEDIDLLEVIIPKLMEAAKKVFPSHKSEWKCPKFHALLHFVQLLLEWGSMSVCSMSFFGKSLTLINSVQICFYCTLNSVCI